MPHKKSAITPEILRLHALDWTSSDIARWLGVSRQLVSKRLEENGISAIEKKQLKRANQPAPEPKKVGRKMLPKTRHLLRMYEDGKGTGEIAQEAGKTQSTISYAIARYVPLENRRHRRRTASQIAPVKARIYALADEGYNGNQIASMTGELPPYVYQVLQERKRK
jgi:transcriptional regulator